MLLTPETNKKLCFINFIPLSLQSCSLGKILLSTHLAHEFAQWNLGKVKYKTMMTVQFLIINFFFVGG